MALIETSIKYVQDGTNFHLSPEEARTAREKLQNFDSMFDKSTGAHKGRIVYVAKRAAEFDQLLSQSAGLVKE